MTKKITPLEPLSRDPDSAVAVDQTEKTRTPYFGDLETVKAWARQRALDTGRSVAVFKINAVFGSQIIELPLNLPADNRHHADDGTDG